MKPPRRARPSKPSAAARTKGMPLQGDKAAPAEGALGIPPPNGAPYWMVKVSGLFLNRVGGLAGDPSKGFVFYVEKAAKDFADEIRAGKLWLGKVSVVLRPDLRKATW